MNRLQTFHETLIPMLVEAVGARSYLEFGSGRGETISKVRCEKRYGVDREGVEIAGCGIFKMETEEFILKHAAQLAPFDFVFIDADHAVDAVRRDFSGIISHVAPEGLVLLHDTNPETTADTVSGLCADSWKFAFHLLGAGYESVTIPFHPGLTIVRNRVLWGPRP